MSLRIVLLQGPVGGFFRHLHGDLEAAGHRVRRLVFNGGDLAFARGRDYRILRPDSHGYARPLETEFGDWRPDAVILFGDERPIHRAAIAAARRIGIPVWCFEEGYIRPDHVTFERDGNNANSRLAATFDPDRPPERSPPAPRLIGQTQAMGWAAMRYFIAMRTTMMFFPGYRHHRERKLVAEFVFWWRTFFRRAKAARHDADMVARLASGTAPPFFLVALQVHDDLQLRRHGRGWTTWSFVEMVLESFRRHAPPDTLLVVKSHPLDIGYGHHRRNLRDYIADRDLDGRVWYLQAGPMGPILRHARGLVTINSTAGLVALAHDVPTMAFGAAFYHVDGLSPEPQGPEDLDRFWGDPPPVDSERSLRFGAHIRASVLIPGSFYLPETWPGIAAAVLTRLAAPSPPITPNPSADS